ncbi:unnamed protein product, partial [Ectocarpus sp. 12 AP-2014]
VIDHTTSIYIRAQRPRHRTLRLRLFYILAALVFYVTDLRKHTYFYPQSTLHPFCCPKVNHFTEKNKRKTMKEPTQQRKKDEECSRVELPSLTSPYTRFELFLSFGC